MLVRDVEVVSSREFGEKSEASYDLLYRAQPIQVDADDPILEKATKLNQLCTSDRDYYLLDEPSPEEYSKLSFTSEENLQPSSLQQCDSLSTTVSEDSDYAAVRVYDLNKRETKILRHDIIKQSRNPVGELTTPPDTPIVATISVQLEPTVHRYKERISENTKETQRSPILPTKLSSAYLNRSPRKFKMADVSEKNNEAVATTAPAKANEEEPNTTKPKSLETAEQFMAAEFEQKSNDANLIASSATESLLQNENGPNDAVDKVTSSIEEPSTEAVNNKEDVTVDEEEPIATPYAATEPLASTNELSKESEIEEDNKAAKAVETIDSSSASEHLDNKAAEAVKTIDSSSANEHPDNNAAETVETIASSSASEHYENVDELETAAEKVEAVTTPAATTPSAAAAEHPNEIVVVR